MRCLSMVNSARDTIISALHKIRFIARSRCLGLPC